MATCEISVEITNRKSITAFCDACGLVRKAAEEMTQEMPQRKDLIRAMELLLTAGKGLGVKQKQ